MTDRYRYCCSPRATSIVVSKIYQKEQPPRGKKVESCGRLTPPTVCRTCGRSFSEGKLWRPLCRALFDSQTHATERTEGLGAFRFFFKKKSCFFVVFFFPFFFCSRCRLRKVRTTSMQTINYICRALMTNATFMQTRHLHEQYTDDEIFAAVEVKIF